MDKKTQPFTRRLAAIMFTDMVGYTALMQEDEQEAMTRRARHREVMERVTANHHGEILQYYGDGTLSIFDSAVEAVLCGVDIQKALRQPPEIPLRIGIHSGDVVFNEEGIYGDGVNVASRIESFATPGSVLVSDKVFDEIKNHGDITTREMGQFKLKNVRRPVGIYAIENEGVVIPEPKDLKGKGSSNGNHIAVLPFLNMSTDPENEYFSDGITEEILNAITRIEGLKVTSRTSSFAFKGKQQDLRDIAKQLKVQTILEGSVRKAGNRVRITAQLINAADDYHFWSESYDRNLDDIFEVQDEIAHEIANKMRQHLREEDLKKEMVARPTNNMEAYEIYLKGRYHWNKLTPPDARRAIELYEKAHEMAPTFLLPLTGLVYAYSYLGAIGQMQAYEAFPRARKIMEKAITLDADHHEITLSKALIALFDEWDMKNAEVLFKKTLAQNPNSVYTRQFYGMMLSGLGRDEEAVQILSEAIKIDPLNLPLRTFYARCLAMTGRKKKAFEQVNAVLSIEPKFRQALEMKGWIYYMTGDPQKAYESFQHLYNLYDDPLKGVSYMGYITAKLGLRDKAEDFLALLKKREKRDPHINLSLDFALLYAGLGEIDNAFKYIEKAYEERVGGLIFIQSYPAWDEFKTDPRFRALLERLNINTIK